ncbi:sodium- and chloride-dependent glycine transporter 2-like [Haliotis rufescens]|uniref:sodium- and chloride-dependent glycine transporter 2-like n=1 Tax=Haliotis rufescens TaxID=6454 RepID=UPI00201EF1E5|nr:sodium- and chloride-dependent glycine transporter 2-like [Haliotis rufescens]
MDIETEETCLSTVVYSDTAENTNPNLENGNVTKPQWSNRFQSIIAVLGFSVGLGNLLRFPYVCQKNGGGAFLIPYVISTTLIAIPLFILEVAIGQFSGKGPIKVWAICPLMKGIGACILSISCMVIPCYGVVFAWTLYYIYNSFSTVLPWTTCGNSWNTPRCIAVGDTRRNSSMYAQLKPVQAINTTEYRHDGIGYKNINTTERVSNAFDHTSTEQFFQYKALGVSSGIEDLGSMQAHLVICWFITCVAIFLCIVKGIKSFGKVLYVTALMPYVLLLVLLVRSCTMPGAVDGILFYLTPDFTLLQHPQVWLEALVQVFFSVGTTWGVIIAMAGHNCFHANVIRDPIIVTVIGELTSVFAGFVVFATVGFLAHDLQLPVADVITPGPGIAFIIYPEAVALLPLPQLWSVLFFTTMLMMSVDSVAGNVETAIDCIEDILPRRYHIRPVIAAVFMGAMFLAGLVFTTNGGVYVFQLVDWYMGTVACFVMAILECVIVGWCYGAERFSSDVEAMIGKRLPVIYKIVCFTILPVVLTVALVSTLASYKPPSYGEYDYPKAAVVVGWFIALVTIVPIPVTMVIQVLKKEGSLGQRVKSAMKPSSSWPGTRVRHGRRKTMEAMKDNFLFIIGLKK